MANDGTKVEVTEIPPLPEAVEVSIPLIGAGKEGGPDDLFALGGEVGQMAVSSFDLEGRLELFPDVSTTDASSVLDPGSMWTVQALADKGDDVEVSVGRRGDRETSFVLPRRRLAGLEAGSLIAAPSESLYKVTSILGTVKALVEFRPDPGSDPLESDIWLPILRLHCPHHAGCEAQYATALAQGSEASLELSVFGLGGGGGQSMTCTVSETYVTAAECIEIAVPAKLVLQLGGTYVNGTQVAYGMRATIKDVDTKALTEQTLPSGHGCDLPFAQVKDKALWQLDRTGGAGGQGNQEWELKLETETEGKLSVGLELGSAPLKLGLDYVRKTSSETTITTGVSAGARYAAYPPAAGGGFEVFWTT